MSIGKEALFLIIVFGVTIIVTLLNEWWHRRKHKKLVHRAIRGMYVPVPPEPDSRSSIELFARLNSKE